MALAWVHQTRLDAVPRKAARNNLAPNRGADASESGGRRTSLGAIPAYANNHQRTGGPKSPGESCAVLLHTRASLTLAHVRLSIANFHDDVEGSSRNTDSADLRGRPTCLQPVRKNVLECLRD